MALIYINIVCFERAFCVVVMYTIAMYQKMSILFLCFYWDYVKTEQYKTTLLF